MVFFATEAQLVKLTRVVNKVVKNHGERLKWIESTLKAHGEAHAEDGPAIRETLVDHAKRIAELERLCSGT